MSIQRYYPEVKYTVRETRINMAPHERGSYVTYESHIEELRRVQAELDALKAMQKSDFSYHMKPIIDKAFQEAVAIVARHMQPVFKVDTEALIAADVGRWMEKHMNERSGFATGSLFVGDIEVDFDSNKVKITDALIKSGVVTDCEMTNSESGFMTRCVMAMPEARSANYVICTSADEGSGFTIGKKYAFDRNEGSVIRICQDDFVSDLAEDDCWIASRRRNLVTGEFRYFLQGHAEGKRASFEIVE